MRVEARIFGVNMEHGALPKRSDDLVWVHTLIEQVARIQISPDNIRTANLAEFLQRARVIGQLARMHFNRNSNPELACLFTRFYPERRRYFIPLPFKQLDIFRLPRASHPIWVAPSLKIARAAAHRDDRIQLEPIGSLQSLVEYFLRAGSSIGIRVEQISVAVQSTQHQASIADRSKKYFSSALVVDERIEIAMRRGREISCSNFDRFNLVRNTPFQRVLKAQVV